MKFKKACLIPGTFDPITIGHLDIIMRAKNLFDEVYVIAFDNSKKKTYFTPKERLELLQLSLAHVPNITVDITNILVVDYARLHEINIIIKGVRSMIDYEYEYQLSLINREMDTNIETLFLPSKSEHMYISSTFVRELILYEKDISKYVPSEIVERINGIITTKNNK